MQVAQHKIAAGLRRHARPCGLPDGVKLASWSNPAALQSFTARRLAPIISRRIQPVPFRLTER